MLLAPDIPTVGDLRAEHDRDALVLSGPGPRLARIGDFVIDGPHGWLPLRAYAPSLAPGLPVVAYLHGGGWTVGSIASFDGVARTLAAASGALVVSIGYRLAPEHAFPVPVDEAVAALRWLADHAGTLGGDGTRLAVAGDSAGANLAAVAARRLRDEGGPRLRMQALVYPVCDVALDTPVRRALRARPRLHRGGDAALLGPLPRRRRRQDPDASPLRAGDVRDLPPAFVATAEADVLRDEGEAYGAALRAAGVRAAIRRYPGTTHGFWRRLARSPAAVRAVGEVGAALRAALV